MPAYSPSLFFFTIPHFLQPSINSFGGVFDIFLDFEFELNFLAFWRIEFIQQSFGVCCIRCFNQIFLQENLWPSDVLFVRKMVCFTKLSKFLFFILEKQPRFYL